MTEPNTFADENIHDMNTNQLTAIKIKDERIRLNYTQQAVADHLGMDISNYSRLESGKVEITISKLEAIAEFFKVPMTLFLPNTVTNIKIKNGIYGNNSSWVKNNHDEELQNSLKVVISLLQKQLIT